MLKKRCSRRCAELALYAAAVYGHILKDKCRGRRRHRQYAVGTVYVSAAHMDRGSNDLIGIQSLHQHAHRSYVSHCIHGANLVEMYLRHRDSMGMTLSFGYEPVYSQYVILHPAGCLQMVPDDVLNVVHSAVMMVMFMLVGLRAVSMIVVMFMLVGLKAVSVSMPMVMELFTAVLVILVFMMMFVSMDIQALFFSTVYLHRDMGAADAAFFRGLHTKAHTRYTEVVQFPQKGLLIRQKLQQRRSQHISCRSHPAVYI